jgi:hypothetical protein
MTIDVDFSVASNGDIRHVSGTTVYSALDLHAWLQDLADNATAAGDDLLSILSDNPSKIAGPRATNKPMSVTLLGSFNIDDTAAQFINFGSVEQSSGNVLYTGVKSIGSPLVSGSPIYLVQNGSKVTSFWPNGHVQVMVKAKTGGAFIDSGDIRAFSRKFGQTYADFATNLVPGSEQNVAISTSLDTNISLSLASALALSSDITVAVGDVTKDLGNGNGGKLYKGTITLSNGRTLAEAYQYLMAITSETSAVTVNSEAGWKYRALNTGYTPNAAAPFGTLAGGKWFVAQGWWLEGVLPAESQNYNLVAHDGTTQIPPNTVGITIGGLAVGDTVIVARDNGSGGLLQSEYTLSGAHTSGMSTITVNIAIKSDTPASGKIRVNGVRFTYTSWTGSVFTISGTLGQAFSSGVSVFVPFIDKVAASTSESVSFIYNANFTARVKVRQGTGGSPIKPFETTFSVGSAGGSTNAIRDSDV